ncbi:MAG: hypothetical protein AAF849_10505 [Bacteroidota bacterium]
MKNLTSFCFVHLISFQVLAQDTLSLFEHLFQEKVLEMSLETDVRKMVKNKYKEIYQAATLSYKSLENDSLIRHSLEIRARGNARKSNCFYPPLKLKFPKKELASLGLNPEFNKIKMVCPCRKGKTYAEYILKEYLAYRLFNIMSDMSFKVQLVEVNFIDEKGKAQPFKGYGFLLEPADELAARFNGEEHKASIVNPKYTMPEQTNLLNIFQYMIGNTDWSINKSHNIFSFRSPDFRLPVAVPYDFDYSGIVNTTYAIPNEDLRIEEVTERLFRGICRTDGSYQAALQAFLDKKELIYAALNELTMLDEKSRNWVANYLDDFFEEMASPFVKRNVFEERCEN